MGLLGTKDQLSHDGYLNWKSYFIELTAMVFCECTECRSCFHVSIQHQLDLLAPPASPEHPALVLPWATEQKCGTEHHQKAKKTQPQSLPF